MRWLFVVLFVACTSPEPTDTADTVRPEAPWPSVEQELFALSGEVTWEVDFDEEAEAAGKTDCQYTRRYTGLEDKSRPWTCRGCHVIVRADVEMVAGRESCFSQVTEADPREVEWIGYAGGSWYRATQENRPLGISTGASVSNGSIEIGGEFTSRSFDDQGLTFRVSGTLEGSMGVGDLLDGLTPPRTSTCGWERSVVEVYDGGTTARLDGTLPDAYLPDACGEGVRLHQLTGEGRYAVVAWVAGGHEGSEAWLSEAEDAASSSQQSVVPIALWSRANNTIWPSPTQEELAEVAAGRSFPILGHRGYGRTVLASEDDYRLPVVAVVGPNRRILLLERGGFSGWETALEVIEADAAMP